MEQLSNQERQLLVIALFDNARADVQRTKRYMALARKLVGIATKVFIERNLSHETIRQSGIPRGGRGGRQSPVVRGVRD